MFSDWLAWFISAFASFISFLGSISLAGIPVLALIAGALIVSTVASMLLYRG